ncbi:hypothetical protein HYX00_02160 [Candidatus Woesearchaeota archaeon]|nr:hypothetical protein [Candidatus Woesearchaeota archaeon]
MEFDAIAPYRTYRVDRGIHYLLQGLLPFNVFGHLESVYQRKSNGKVEVLEGGCGVGAALEDLKTGVGHLTPNFEVKSDFINVPPWKRLPNGYQPGLVGKIYTTGVTLSPRHVDIASRVKEPFGIDEMVVGPIEQHNFQKEYDFIFDLCGAAFYFPEEVIAVYGRILKRGELGFLRLLAGANEPGYFLTLFYKHNLESVDKNGSPKGQMDFVVQRV